VGVLEPSAQVYDAVETFAVEGQLRFVDDQAGIDGVLAHRVGDLVEGSHHGFEIRLKQFTSEVGRGEQAGHGDAFAFDLFRLHRLGRDDHRAVAVADA